MADVKVDGTKDGGARVGAGDGSGGGGLDDGAAHELKDLAEGGIALEGVGADALDGDGGAGEGSDAQGVAGGMGK